MKLLVNPNDYFLLTGDFNLPEAEWVSHSSPGMILLSNNSYGTQALQDFLSFTELKQFNYIYTRNKRILDLIMCNAKCTVTACDYPLTPEDFHHKSLNIDIDLNFE